MQKGEYFLFVFNGFIANWCDHLMRFFRAQLMRRATFSAQHGFSAGALRLAHIQTVILSGSHLECEHRR